MGLFSDIWGTTKSTFQIALSGVRLKNVTGNLVVRNAADGADAEVTAAKVHISGEVLEFNSDASEVGADWKVTVQRPASGMTAAYTLTLPIDDGTPSQVLQTDGDGVLSWASAGSTAACMTCDTTSLAFNTGSPLSLFTLPINAVIHKVQVIIDTAFTGTAPTLSIGISGTTSKYMGTTDVNLKGTAEDVYETTPGKIAAGGTEALIATYVPDSAATGAARILVFYSVPA